MQINSQVKKFSTNIGKRLLVGLKFSLVISLLAYSALNLSVQLKTKTVKIFNNKASRKAKLVLQVEMADTEQTLLSGLSYRKSLPEKHGMLFSFRAPQKGFFWGKNTFIPLDLIFIDNNRKIVQISQIKSHDLTQIVSKVPVLYAIELNQGTANKYGLQVGDQLAWDY